MTPLIEDKAEKTEFIFLSYKKGSFNKISSDDIKDDNTLILMKAGNLCRNENFLSSEPMLQGTTCEGLIKSSPSANLQQLVSYILQGKSSSNSRDMISRSIC